MPDLTLHRRNMFEPCAAAERAAVNKTNKYQLLTFQLHFHSDSLGRNKLRSLVCRGHRFSERNDTLGAYNCLMPDLMHDADKLRNYLRMEPLSIRGLCLQCSP